MYCGPLSDSHWMACGAQTVASPKRAQRVRSMRVRTSAPVRGRGAAIKPKTFTLDGEVAVFDAELVSRFEWLRHINHGDLATPPLFMVFDLLHLGEKDYRPESLEVRRRALEKLVKAQMLILPARRLSPNGLAAWAEVLHRGYEGMVAKDPASL